MSGSRMAIGSRVGIRRSWTTRHGAQDEMDDKVRVLFDGGGTKDVLESLAVIGEHATVIDETLPGG